MVVKTSKLWNNTWNHVVTKKVIIQSSHPLPWQICTFLAFSQPASPGMLFQQPWWSSQICWAIGCFSFTLRSNSSQTISNWVEVRSLCRPGHLMQHAITLLLGQIALTHSGCVMGKCPVEKQMIVALNANQRGWCIAAEFCGSHAV